MKFNFRTTVIKAGLFYCLPVRLIDKISNYLY